MSRTLCSLGVVGLTLALVMLSEVATTAAADPGSEGQAGRVVPGGSGPHGHRVIRTAQKARKKGQPAPAKRPAAEAGKEAAAAPATKPAEKDGPGPKFSRDI